MKEINQDNFDLIRVLLVDDMPEGLPRPASRGAPDVPVMASAYSKWFEFRWLATPEECREFRDLSWLISQHNPRLLTAHGWIPELLVVDYALTQDTRTVAERVEGDCKWLDRLSPLPKLRGCAAGLPGNHSLDHKPVPVHAPAGSEYWGCFIGGLLLNTFGEHPCAPVTVTRYDQETLKRRAVDAAFFEYLMDVQSSGLLKAQGRTSSPPWKEVLESGAENLLHRLRALAKAGIVIVSLEDLLSLAENGTHPVLTVTSRYGRRRYPVDGIFIKAPAGEQRAEAARVWARKLLQEAWYDAFLQAEKNGFECSLQELIAGRKVANDLWKAYDSDELEEHFDARLKMSHLLATSEKQEGDIQFGESEAAELKQLFEKFGVADPNDRKGCSEGYWDLRESDVPSGAQRWAVLLSLVRLLHRRHQAISRSHDLPEDVLPQGKRLSFEKPVDADDLYLVLFPIAKNPLKLPWHAKDPSRAKNAWQQHLSRLDIAPGDILKGKGLHLGERMILRMYAESLEYDWKTDDSPPAKSLLGGAGVASS